MQFLNRSKKFVKDDSGLMSVFGIFVVLGMLIVGALAVDMSNGYRIRTHLQVAADAAAHTALYHREWHTEDEAVARAIEVFEDSLPPALVGKAVLTAEVVCSVHAAGARATPVPIIESRVTSSASSSSLRLSVLSGRIGNTR